MRRLKWFTDPHPGLGLTEIRKLDEIFPTVRFEDYRRALCILDPYKLNPDWTVVVKAGEMKSAEIFLNFMVMDMNMNVLWKNPSGVAPAQIERMNRFWGMSRLPLDMTT
jgi:three-Cys-motif partner protein